MGNSEKGYIYKNETGSFLRNTDLSCHGNSFDLEMTHSSGNPARLRQFGKAVATDLMLLVDDSYPASLETIVCELANQEPPIQLPDSAYFYAGAISVLDRIKKQI